MVSESSAKFENEPGSGMRQTEYGLLPLDWPVVQLTSKAKLESGHTPSRRKPEYWNGSVPWVSLHDTDALNGREITHTAQSVTAAGIANSSARILPKGTVVFSRTATVGKSTVLGRDMATSQDFACYICGPEVHNHFLVYLFRHMAPEWKKLMAGSIHNTVYMPVFRDLRVVLPPIEEQRAIAAALSDADALIAGLESLIAKKRAIQQGAMQALLTGGRRLAGFNGEWETRSLSQFGTVYGGLTGKTKRDFGHGGANYIPFLNVISNPVVDLENLLPVDVREVESQNRVRGGDLFFNGSSETPEEVGLCATLNEDVPNLYLNSFCFGFRPSEDAPISALYLTYMFRSSVGRKLLAPLAQGGIRYNLSKRALLGASFPCPPIAEQEAISDILSQMDLELEMQGARLAKIRQIKQGMMQELLTGRIRLV